MQSEENVLQLTNELEKVSQHIDESSYASADVLNDYRSSLKSLIAQIDGVFNSLDDLRGASKTSEVESIFKDPDYRSDYYHSIEQVEFGDDYGSDQEGCFTVDELLVIGAPAHGIRKLGSLAQFYGHPNPQAKEVTARF